MVFKVSQLLLVGCKLLVISDFNPDKYTVYLRIPVKWHHLSKDQDKHLFHFAQWRENFFIFHGFDLKFLPNTCTNMCYRCSFNRFWYVKFVVFLNLWIPSNRNGWNHHHGFLELPQRMRGMWGWTWTAAEVKAAVSQFLRFGGNGITGWFGWTFLDSVGTGEKWQGWMISLKLHTSLALGMFNPWSLMVSP